MLLFSYIYIYRREKARPAEDDVIIGSGRHQKKRNQSKPQEQERSEREEEEEKKRRSVEEEEEEQGSGGRRVEGSGTGERDKGAVRTGRMALSGQRRRGQAGQTERDKREIRDRDTRQRASERRDDAVTDNVVQSLGRESLQSSEEADVGSKNAQGMKTRARRERDEKNVGDRREEEEKKKQREIEFYPWLQPASQPAEGLDYICTQRSYLTARGEDIVIRLSSKTSSPRRDVFSSSTPFIIFISFRSLFVSVSVGLVRPLADVKRARDSDGEVDRRGPTGDGQRVLFKTDDSRPGGGSSDVVVVVVVVVDSWLVS
ncbi:hypothetical protein TRV_06332 [Trichophyton verrucosum HKI 0517]|uniref:Uncharacterized protein n=1 Tax=Trichophyton verrucosum (strain HKI 0517) TaxID=663202 RepID=D4DGM7_TRIVH|nr:uncharacterized protein TRV_06332 [Trichophyton verrucosum HKI 0517]EFE38969.1 hypothetical protein TRV_06332 [Trichophyton verrucosum HKI 0517]